MRKRLVKFLRWVETQARRTRYKVDGGRWVYVPEPNPHLGRVALAGGEDQEGEEQ